MHRGFFYGRIVPLSMGLILSIETATPVCAVALHQQGTLLAHKEHHLEKSHSEMLAPMVVEVLQQGGKTVDQLDAVAVSAGPGSYTGLRIGTATAKGICFGNEIPLIAVNTLEALYAQVRQHGKQEVDLYCPMLDARRMEVYCMILNKQGQTIKALTPLVIDQESFKEELHQHTLLFFGSGADKCKPVITASNAQFLDDVHPTARTMGGLAWTKFQQNEFEDLAYFEPWYLKEFQTIAPKKNAGFNL